MAAARVVPTAWIVASALWSLALPAAQKTADSTAQPAVPSCRFEENCHCDAPGITARWKAAVCMAREQTDDFEHRGVQSCFRRPDPEALRTATSCERNAYWKRELCTATRAASDVQSCAQDPTFIPRVVEHGVGG